MRLSIDLLFLGLLAALAGWLARAPADPQQRANYLCAPVAVFSHAAARMEVAMTDDGRSAPPVPRWHMDPERDCHRIVLIFATTDGRP